MFSDLWPWPISSRSFNHEFSRAAEIWHILLCPIYSSSIVFPYLTQNDLWPWPKYSRSSSCDFACNKTSKICHVFSCLLYNTYNFGWILSISLVEWLLKICCMDTGQMFAVCLHLASGITLWLNYIYNGLCQGNHFINQFCKFVRYICGLGYSKFCKHFDLNMMHCDSSEIFIGNYLHITHIS